MESLRRNELLELISYLDLNDIEKIAILSKSHFGMIQKNIKNILDKYGVKLFKKASSNILIAKYTVICSKMLSIKSIKELEATYEQINTILLAHQVTERVLIEYINEYKRDEIYDLDWKNMSINGILSESFIRGYQDKLWWYFIFKYQKLSESFIIEFMHKADENDNYGYSLISEYQKLSELFIREYQNKLYLPYIFSYQKISESFARELLNGNIISIKNLLRWAATSSHNKILRPLLEEYRDKKYPDLVINYQLYKSGSYNI